MRYLQKVLYLTAGVGEQLLRCGAEIARVEETMERIAKHYGTTKQQVFIISNGVFVNLEMGTEERETSLEPIMSTSVDLNKLCELNNLSRKIEQMDLEIDAAIEEFEALRQGRKYNKWLHVLCSGIGAAAFCYFLGGGTLDCMVACLMGILVWGFFLALEPLHLSNVLLHIAASFIAAGGCVLMMRMGMVENLDKAIVGAIIPLLPSVAFVNGVRDLVDQNYISGGVRMVDAILLFTCITTGVFLALQLGGRV